MSLVQWGEGCFWCSGVRSVVSLVQWGEGCCVFGPVGGGVLCLWCSGGRGVVSLVQ